VYAAIAATTPRSHFRAVHVIRHYIAPYPWRKQMKRNAFLMIFSAGVIALAAWQIASSGPADEATAPTTGMTAPANTTPALAGYVLHLDENGQIVEEPSNAASPDLNATLKEALNTSSEGLTVENSAVPGGGVFVDLQGRFQSTQIATVDPNGKVTAPCLTNEADVKAITRAATDAAKKE
jgi:hypothetical protein